MASAYELMLVLRGRNYLSNDLRRAGADIGRLRSMNQLSTARSQLSINAQRLANTRSLAQQEIQSIQRGVRRNALDKALLAQSNVQADLQGRIKNVEDARMRTNTALLRNAEEQVRLSRIVDRGGNVRGRTQQETRMMFSAAQRAGEDLAAQQVRNARQLEAVNRALSKQTVVKQGLIERDAALAAREAHLTDVINTTTAAEELNTRKLVENAIAMRRLPLEQLAARAAYVEHLGRAFQTLGLISTAVLGSMAYSASKFQTGGVLAATQMITQSSNSVAQIQRTGAFLNDRLLKFLASGKSVLNSQEAQEIAYTIPSGIPSLKGDSISKAKQTVAIIKELNQVIKANFGLVTPDEAASGAIILVNTFHDSVARLPHDFDVMQSAVNRGKLTMGEFIQGLSQTAPAARAAGYSFTDMSSVLSFLSGKLPQYTRVATGYARALELFQNLKLQQYMKAHGAAITDTSGRLLSFNKIIEQFVKLDPKLATKRGNLIADLTAWAGTKSTAQARRIIIPALQDISGLNSAIAEVPTNAAGLVNASATALSKTGAVKWAQLTTQFKALAIEIGTGAIPAFQHIAQPIEAAFNWFNKLSPSTKRLVGEIAAFVSVGTLLGGTFLVIAGAATRLYATLRLLGIMRTIKAAGGIEGLAGKATTGSLLGSEAGQVSVAMAGKLGLVGVIASMIIFHKQTGEVVDALGGFQNALTLVSAAIAAFGVIRGISGVMLLTAKLRTASLEAIGLRAALMPLAGLVISTVVIIHYRRQFEDAIKNAAKGSGIPAFDSSMDPTGYGKAQYNRGPLGWVEKNFGETATKGPGGFFNRLTHEGPYSDALKQADKDAASTKELMRKYGNLKKLQDDLFHIHWPDIPAKPPTVKPPSIIVGATATPRSIQEWITMMEKARKTMLGDPGDLQKAKNYERLQNSLNTTFKEQPALLAAINDVLSNYDSELSKSGKTTKQTLEDISSNVMSMYDSILQQSQSVMGQLFAGPYSQSPRVQNRLQFGGMLNAGDYLKDIHSQINQFKNFYGEIDKLQRRGAPTELIQQLIQAGPTALPAIKALAGMGAGQWKEYIATFNRGQELLHKQTIKQLRAQLTDYRKYGNNIAYQIIAGMRDKRLGLANEIKSIIHQMFGISTPEVTKAHKKALADASKAAKTTTAAHTAGAYKGHSNTTKPVVGTHSRVPQGITQHNHNETHYHVNAPTSDHASITTQLRHADFVRTTKYSKV